MEEKERYELIGYCSYRDTETGVVGDNFVELLNQKDKKIKNLEHQLSNCIEPKFKIGQEVLVNDWTGQLRSGEIFEIQTNQVKFDQVPLITYLVDYGAYSYDDQENDYFEEKDVFVTEEEAKAKLEELGNV